MEMLKVEISFAFISVSGYKSFDFILIDNSFFLFSNMSKVANAPLKVANTPLKVANTPLFCFLATNLLILF